MAGPTDTDATVPPGQTNQLQREIAMGIDMERFRESPVGQYFAARASDDILTMMNELKALDIHAADGLNRFAKLQQDIHARELVLVWMNDAVEQGRSAVAQLELNERTPVDPIG